MYSNRVTTTSPTGAFPVQGEQGQGFCGKYKFTVDKNSVPRSGNCAIKEFEKPKIGALLTLIMGVNGTAARIVGKTPTDGNEKPRSVAENHLNRDSEIIRVSPRQKQGMPELDMDRRRDRSRDSHWSRGQDPSRKDNIFERLHNLFTSNSETKNEERDAIFGPPLLRPNELRTAHYIEFLARRAVSHGATPAERSEFYAHVDSLESDFHCGVILRALTAYNELTGDFPDIIPGNSESGDEVLAPTEHRRAEWHLNLNSLRNRDASDSLATLREVYTKLTGFSVSPGGVRRTPLATLIAQRKVPIDPDQKEKWRQWANEVNDPLVREKRALVARELEVKAQEMRLYGGVPEDVLAEVLGFSDNGGRKPKMIFELQLSKADEVTGWPPLPEEMETTFVVPQH